MPAYNEFQDVSLRPLNKGMFTDFPPNGIPKGGFHDLKNFRVKEGYIETRGGFYPYFNGNVPLSGTDLINYEYLNLKEKIQDIIHHWKTTQQSETIIITEKFLYELINRNTVTHALLVSGELVTTLDTVVSDILTTNFSSGTETNIRVGDYIREFGTTVVVGEVLAISAGTYTIRLDPSYTWITGTSIEAVHTFTVASGYKIDSTVLGGYGTNEAGNVMILTDQADRGVYKYSDGALTIYNTDSSPLQDGLPENQILGSAKSCTFFDDRLWLGNVTETSGRNYPQRVWWSDALNFNRFNPINYMDLPYSQGELLAIKPLGPLLVLYFTDTLYIGRATNIAGRPYEFQEINTNGIGLVSQGALGTYDDGHFFVGQDDIYYLSGSAALQRIGAPIKSQTVEKTAELGLLDFIQVAPDPSNESVVFLFPDVPKDVIEAQGLATKLWRFYYKPQAWGYDEGPIINDQAQSYFSSISAARTVTRNETYQSWYDLDGVTGDPKEQTADYINPWPGNRSLNAIYRDDAGVPGTPPNDQKEWFDYSSYNELNSFAISSPKLFIGAYYLGSSGYFLQNILYESLENYQDNINFNAYDIDYQIVSPDFDFGAPDTDKFTRQFSIRTMEHVDTYFEPSVWVSDGKARINAVTGVQDTWWQAAPSVKFFSNYNEGKTGFLIRGSIFKFKVKFVRSTERYKISEIILRTKIESTQSDQ